jgi:RHH-type rel operon transcriptional repressor/antitoxin RelB
MLTVRLLPEIEKRIEALVRKTGRTKNFYAREAILRYFEDLEDHWLARRRLIRGAASLSLRRSWARAVTPGFRHIAMCASAPTVGADGRFPGGHPQ